MPSTDASASGRSACSAVVSAGPSSKKARTSAWRAASSPTRLASGSGADPPRRSSPEPEPELIDLPVEGREGEPEPIRGAPLVALGPAQHRLDVHPLVGAERLAEVVAARRLGAGVALHAAREVRRRDPL